MLEKLHDKFEDERTELEKEEMSLRIITTQLDQAKKDNKAAAGVRGSGRFGCPAVDALGCDFERKRPTES